MYRQLFNRVESNPVETFSAVACCLSRDNYAKREAPASGFFKVADNQRRSRDSIYISRTTREAGRYYMGKRLLTVFVIFIDQSIKDIYS